MSGNGLIYAAIVGAWAAYLIPLWLRRHEDASAAGLDVVSSAMRVLSRRTPTLPEQRYLLRPRSAPPVPVVKRSTLERPSAPPSRTSGTADVMTRRRRVLITLATALLVCSIGVALGLAPWPVVVPLVALFMLYVVGLRILARRERVTSRSRKAHAERPVRVGRAAAPAERRTAAAVEPATPGASIRIGQPVRPAVDGGWDPVAVPLPTYVTAPKAVRATRPIELSGDGAWTSGRLIDQEVPARRPTVVPDLPPSTGSLDSGSVQQPRAVND